MLHKSIEKYTFLDNTKIVVGLGNQSFFFELRKSILIENKSI